MVINLIITILNDFLIEPIGYIGMGLFWLAWVVQIYQSHKEQKSTIKWEWWVLRATGVGCMLYHSIVIQDIMYILSNVLTLGIVYSYNLYLLVKEKNKVKKNE